MSKKLNETAIANELRGQSAFFRQPTPLPTVSPPARPSSTEPVETPSRAAIVTTPPSPSVDETVSIKSTNIPERPYERTTERANGRTPVRENDRTGERANARTRERRSIIRHSFEFYHDQIETLKKLSLEAKMRGEKGSMSEMIREAVDIYIEQQQNTAASSTRTTERANDRTDGR